MSSRQVSRISSRRKKIVPSEQVEAEALASWLRLQRFDFTHIPNETGSSDEAKRRAIRMKRAGTSRGFPDYLIFARGYNIAIELKKLDGTASKEQKEWLAVLARYGFHSAVCHGWQEAKQFVQEVIKGGHHVDRHSEAAEPEDDSVF